MAAFTETRDLICHGRVSYRPTPSTQAATLFLLLNGEATSLRRDYESIRCTGALLC